MPDNPIAMAGVGAPGMTSGNDAGGPLGKVPSGGGAPQTGNLGALGQIDQLRAGLQSVFGVLGRPNLVITRHSDGVPLWIDLLGATEGGVTIPGHTIGFQLGEPPQGAYTNPVTFFAQGIASSAPLGVSIWVWLAAAGVFLLFVLPRLRGGKR